MHNLVLLSPLIFLVVLGVCAWILDRGDKEP